MSLHLLFISIRAAARCCKAALPTSGWVLQPGWHRGALQVLAHHGCTDTQGFTEIIILLVCLQK